MRGPTRRAVVAVCLAIALSTAAPRPAAHSAPRGALQDDESHARMLDALGEIARSSNGALFETNVSTLRDQLARISADADAVRRALLLGQLAGAETHAGELDSAIRHLQETLSLLPRLPRERRGSVAVTTLMVLGSTRIRQGILANCTETAGPGSCILPTRPGAAFENETEAVRQGIDRLAGIARNSPRGHPVNLGARWLVTVATLLLGEAPGALPESVRIDPELFRPTGEFPRFANVGPAAGLNALNFAGGAAVEDFDGDGLLDVATSSSDPGGPARLFLNAGDGTFVERTAAANLQGITGGVNMEQADYDDDGDVDLLILRGAWRNERGRWPNSLLRNDGTGRFQDVTFAAGLGEVHYPTQVGAWADYDLDGDLDLFVGNEAQGGSDHPSQLFRNEGDGTFIDVAVAAGVDNRRWAKGAAWGDYDDDGDPDLYVSNRLDANRLYRNDGDGTFTDVAADLGVIGPSASFSPWFWDVDQDGHLDLLVNSYLGRGVSGALPPLWHVPASRMGLDHDGELPALYLADGEGGFRDVAVEWGIGIVTMPMGSNFGDLDNDGWLDFYLGTGYPGLEGLVPNVMYRNRNGEGFDEVTWSGGFGDLMKGHGVAFADLDNDGDQDVFEQMGGFYVSDQARDVLFENPGFGHHWVTLELRGGRANHFGVGARIRVVAAGPDGRRELHHEIGTGGSFGADPFRAEIGLGSASRIERLEIRWPGDPDPQVFRNLPVDRFYRVQQDADAPEPVERRRIDLADPEDPASTEGTPGT